MDRPGHGTPERLFADTGSGEQKVDAVVGVGGRILDAVADGVAETVGVVCVLIQHELVVVVRAVDPLSNGLKVPAAGLPEKRLFAEQAAVDTLHLDLDHGPDLRREGSGTAALPVAPPVIGAEKIGLSSYGMSITISQVGRSLLKTFSKQTRLGQRDADAVG